MRVGCWEGLQVGAIGLSLGLMYAPGNYTSREELVELCSVVAEYDGLLATHIRGEGNSLIPSVEEVIWIADDEGAGQDRVVQRVYGSQAMDFVGGDDSCR